MALRFRILKTIYPNGKEFYFIQRAVRFCRIHLWWKTLNVGEVISHNDAVWFMEQCCDDFFFQYREQRSAWHKENMV